MPAGLPAPKPMQERGLRPPLRAMAASDPTSTDDAVSRSFLRHRVGRFGLLVGALFGTFLTFRLVASTVSGQLLFVFEPSMLWHAASTFAFLGVWLACRLGPATTAYVRGVETVGLLVGTLGTVWMGAYIPIEMAPELIALMALSLGLSARSIYVPSSWGRTLALGLAMGVPIVVATYAYYVVGVESWRLTYGVIASEHTPVVKSVATAVWWALAVTVATAASQVIYGLRKEVRDARQVGQYRLEEKLGEGGMGAVYKARHALLRRPTAVKLLPPDRTGDALERFEREVQLTASLTHPNTVTIFDYGRSTDGTFYYAMELIDGATLDELVEVGGPQPEARVRALIRQAADALVEAHGIGLIHRDIKPANIMVYLPHHVQGLNEMAKVVDFGLVKRIETRGAPGSTAANVITGTPQYMAPESIVDPEKVDGRVDIYALGAVAWFLLAGRHLFEAKTIIEMCSKHLNEPAGSPSEARGSAVSPAFERLVLSCLEKDPEKRPQSAAALRDALDAIDGLGEWGPSEAAGWWAEFTSPLSRGRDRIVMSVGETLDIRFAHRETVVASSP